MLLSRRFFHNGIDALEIAVASQSSWAIPSGLRAEENQGPDNRRLSRKKPCSCLRGCL